MSCWQRKKHNLLPTLKTLLPDSKINLAEKREGKENLYLRNSKIMDSDQSSPDLLCIKGYL